MQKITFVVPAELDLIEVEATLQLALVCLEALHGDNAVQLQCAYWIDEAKRTIAIRASTQLGMDSATLFRGLCRREWGKEIETQQPAAAPTL